MNKITLLVILKLASLVLSGILYFIYKEDCETKHEQNVLFFLWLLLIVTAV